ncbi:unnamed protein product [Mytilus edulis]|uniref:Uncharacterized protein n=1 Tax=Mytilus edulis TaxID=6550 RepID=A0A8S3VA34_MYTED|nr:unnamed protein product [Mytilus edulis]
MHEINMFTSSSQHSSDLLLSLPGWLKSVAIFSHWYNGYSPRWSSGFLEPLKEGSQPPDDIEDTSWITKCLKNQADLSAEKKKKMKECNSNVQVDSQKTDSIETKLLVRLVSHSKTVNTSHLDTELIRNDKVKRKQRENIEMEITIDSDKRKDAKKEEEQSEKIEMKILLTPDKSKDKGRKTTERENRDENTINSDKSKDKRKEDNRRRENRDDNTIDS